MKQTEREEQIRVFDVLRLNEAQYPFLKFIHASMSGLYSGSARMAIDRKRQGQKAGIPDICIPLSCGHSFREPSGGCCPGAYVEMKSAKGRVSPEQNEFLEFVKGHNYATKVAYSCDEALAFIEQYLAIKLRGWR